MMNEAPPIAPGSPRPAGSPRVFYGWWIVFTGLMSMFMSAGFGFYALSALYGPLQQDLGWNRGLVSSAISLSFLLSGLAGPFVGRWTDRFGPKPLMLVGAGFTGLSLIIFGAVNSVWQLYACFVVSAIGRTGTTGVPASAVVANWFVRRRGVAMGLLTSGIGIGGMVTAPLTGYLIGRVNWRWTLVIFGLIVWVVLLPLVALIIRTRPSDIGLLPDGDSGGPASSGDRGVGANEGQKTSNGSLVSNGWTITKVLRTRTFWLIGVAYAFVAYPISAVILHSVPYFTDRGISPAQATAMLGSIAALGVAGKLICGFLADRLPIRHIFIFTIALQVVGLVVLMNTNSELLAWTYVVIYGFGMGGIISLTPLLVAGTYGLGSFGVIYGATQLFYAVGWAAGPVVAGWIYDASQSYTIALSIDLVLYLISALAILMVRPVRLPALAIGERPVTAET